MIVVDSSVWIAHLRNQNVPAVQHLSDLTLTDKILVGDIVLTEVLQGARNDAHAAQLEQWLTRFPVVAMVGSELAVQAAHYYRLMRARGFTMNKIADLYIGTFCIQHGHELLQCDADFQPMATLCGLRLLS